MAKPMDQVFEQLESFISILFPNHITSMRTKTPAVANRFRSPTPDRTSRLQLFGPTPSPRPSKTYGRSRRRTSAMPPRSRSPPVTSSSTPSRIPVYDLTLDYDEPVLLPDTSSRSSHSTPSPSGSPPKAANSMSSTHKGLGISSVDSDSDDEPVFISMKVPATQVALPRAPSDLEMALQNANNTIKNSEETAEVRNRCPCCLEVMFQPFILSCGHTFCKECLLRLSNIYLNAKMNFACPDCRTVQGRFTPIPNYVSQQSVDKMLESKGIKPPPHQPLQWPLRFQSRPMSLPFPRRNGTYPVSAPTFAPAPFPIATDDD
ncbi:hypothetical protein C8J55DRAFT_607337 [Lentinula edodes]|uniref:RING-type domain-containing protein n=1 Tax=Lentinula lateritia TaxID=40482 RepID=A0A9W9DJX4_9AGAR|nr:hypothetical protein C8J55DRAFT_607337 [Lentinula edodes]